MRRYAVIFVIVCVVLLGTGGRANAVASLVFTPTAATAGSTVDLTFHVTNVQQAVTADEITISFPASPAVAGASATAPPGWTSTVDASSGAVATVTFSAGTLAPGQAGDFVLTTPLPSVNDRLIFKVQQGFTNNTTVLADSASLNVTGAVTTTTQPTSAGPTSTSAPAATTSTTAGLKIPALSVKKNGSFSAGKILIAIGALVALTMWLRVRRVRK